MAILVEEGNTAGLKRYATCVQVKAILFEMATCAAQVANMQERATLHLMSFLTTPEAFITKLVPSPIPGAFHRFPNTHNVTHVER